jgi:hypothetical protein
MLKVLILDLTHGGDKIGREYLALGHDVTLVDVYRTSKAEERRLLELEGLRVLDAAPGEFFDLAVVPVHCPDRFLGAAHFERRITHHHAVGQLIRFPVPVVEVTGAGAKTTTCFLLSHLLAKMGRRVLLHTSRGDFLVSDATVTLNKVASIAPASLIPLSRLEGFDIAVLEESLGGCGLGKVCAITTLGDNYPIAGGTRKAFDGKVQMVRLAQDTVVIPREEEALWQQDIEPSVRTICFGEQGDVDAELDGHLQLGVPLTIELRSMEERVKADLPSAFLAPSYLTAFRCATAIMVGLGYDISQVAAALEGFKGVPGRGEVSREGNWYFVRDRNPGVSARSIEWNLGVLESYYRISDIGLVIDPVDHKVCEKLDMKAIMEVARSHPSVKKVYLFDRGPKDADLWKEVPHIQNAYDVWNMHKVVLWCTKEGYL